MDPEFKKRWIEELERLEENERRGFVVGVEISKPKSWPPATVMVQLHEAGMDVKAISKKTGYSVPTVERNLKTRGEDPRMGPQCEKYSGKVFSVDEALKEMPLPCGPKCICSWRPILRSDRETKNKCLIIRLTQACGVGLATSAVRAAPLVAHARR